MKDHVSDTIFFLFFPKYSAISIYYFRSRKNMSVSIVSGSYGTLQS